MKSTKPIVGVTGPKKGGTSAWWFTRFSVWMQGAEAVRITPGQGAHQKKRYDLDALILGGGADIHPDRYGQPFEEEEHAEFTKPKPSSLRQWLIRAFSFLFYPFLFLIRKLFSVPVPATDTERDELELGLLEEALDKNIPILGICRGAQLINVKMGGTLYRDIGGFYGEIPRIHSIWPRKRIRIDPESRLGEIIGKDRISVNALHRQAVEQLGDPLKVAAKEENGIIQAIELRDYPFLIGVQWHPEYMPQSFRQRRLFKSLVEAVKMNDR